MSTTVQTPPMTCLGCGEQGIDAATNPFDDDVKPSPGDVTICLYCGHIMAFADDLTIRALTDDEMIEVAGDKQILAIQAARGKVMGGKKQ